MSSPETPGIRFGPFFLDTASRRLLRAGRRVQVSPLELKLLETLLRHRERVLSGDELRVLVWSEDPAQPLPPAQDVNALYVAVRKLRKALGEHAGLVVNIPKVGYTISEEAVVEQVGAGEGGGTRKAGGAGAASAPREDLTTFVGRRAEAARSRELLGRTRLLTLTGPPGIGKTRLAAHVAGEVAADYRHGVCAVDLVPVADEALVAKAVLTALGLPEQAGRGVEEALREHLRERQLLLVLDNCEHVVAACAALAEDLLRACPLLRVLATSREALNIAGETVFVVPPLTVPAAGEADLTRSEAAELFVALARRRRPDFAPGGRDAAALAELCRQLEGIPVAVELAAAQVDAYTVPQILSMTADRFRVLRRRGGDTSRHQTLEGAIAWSYGLLGAEERALLRRLSVFVGGWADETAREVCAGEGVREGEVVHLLARLVRASLVQTDDRRGFHRYRMLEMIRQFSRERLGEAGEEEALLARHSRHFLRLAERAFDEGERGDWPALLAAEHDNLRAVLGRAVREGGDLETGLRLCGALVRFWFNHGHIGEARRWTLRALELDDGTAPRAARARALLTAGFFFGQMAEAGEDSARGLACFEEGLAIWRALGARRELALMLSSYSFLLNRRGEFEGAKRASRESLEVFRELGDTANLARAANNLALTLLDLGEIEQALPLFAESLAAARRAEDRFIEATTLHNLGDAAVQAGDLARADERLAHSLALFDELGHRPLAARTVILQGEAAAARGDFEGARAAQSGALRELHEIGDTQGVATALEALVCTEAASGRYARALTLGAAAAALRQRVKLPLGPARRRILERCAARAARALGADEARAAEGEGRALPPGEVVRLASGQAPADA